MRFSYAESMIDPTMYAPLVRAAEEAGFDSFVIPDSICYPLDADSRYPYNADGSREFLEGKPFIEPFSLIPALAAVTERIRFTTFVVKLPVRHPALVAKQVTSVGVITGGRFRFGVGTSPWREDYDVTGVPWERRGARMDECIKIIDGLQSGEFFGYSGDFYEIPEIQLCPVPDKRVPILIGGHFGDGPGTCREVGRRLDPRRRRPRRVGAHDVGGRGVAPQTTAALSCPSRSTPSASTPTPPRA